MQYVRNINKVFKQAQAHEVKHGKTWYRDALRECEDMAACHGLPVHIVAGVVAALSPTNKWERNLVDAHYMCKTFVDGGYVEDCSPCTYKTMRDKAWSILQSMPHNVDDVAFILNGPKITDFFMCIMGQDVCVIDGHAWGIAFGDRRNMQDVPSIGKRMRKELQQAYSRAGKKHGLTAYQMQAATWVTWKRIHNV